MVRKKQRTNKKHELVSTSNPLAPDSKLPKNVPSRENTSKPIEKKTTSEELKDLSEIDDGGSIIQIKRKAKDQQQIHAIQKKQKVAKRSTFASFG